MTIETDGTIPPAGTRTAPGDSYLALFVANPQQTGNYEVFFNSLSSRQGQPVHGYRFLGLEITAPANLNYLSYGLVILAPYTTGHIAMSDLPYNYDFEHCYIHGATPDQEVGRGISAAINGLKVIDCTIAEIHSTFIESNAIYGSDAYNWLIQNNDLEAACENLLIGGNTVQVTNGEPSGLVFKFNYVHKPLAWRTYITVAGVPYIMKNLFELKNMRNALIDSNLFEYSWESSQNGTAILFTPRMAPAGNFLAAVQNVAFTDNIVRHAVNGINLGLYDDSVVSSGFGTLAQALAESSQNFFIWNNLFDDLDGVEWGYNITSQAINYFGANVIGYPHFLVIDHNTIQFGPSVLPNSSSIDDNTNGYPNFTGNASDVIITYNMLGDEIFTDGATGPTAVIHGATFNHNTIEQSYTNQVGWNAVFPGQSNIAQSKANPDGRGANLSQLSQIESMVRAGK